MFGKEAIIYRRKKFLPAILTIAVGGRLFFIDTLLKRVTYSMIQTYMVEKYRFLI